VVGVVYKLSYTPCSTGWYDIHPHRLKPLSVLADSQNQQATLSYDRAGNITDDGDGMVFTYDAWNRLVKSERNTTTLGTYAYDGLGRRIKHNVGGGAGNDQYEYYTKSWQRIEVRPNGEASQVGVSMFVFGIRYVDDIILRVRYVNASGPPEERRYYLTDANYHVVMRVDALPVGRGVERMFYSAYGQPECFPFGDVDGDYDVGILIYSHPLFSYIAMIGKRIQAPISHILYLANRQNIFESLSNDCTEQRRGREPNQ